MNRQIMVLIVSVLSTAAFCGATAWFFQPDAQLYQFFFYRSPIQYATLFLCAVSLTVLGSRWLERRRNHRVLKSARANEAGWQAHGDVVARQYNSIREQLIHAGGVAACSRFRDVVEEQRKAIRRAYDPVHYLVGLLPVCGLFGTLLGLTRALFTGFSGTVGADAVPRFVQALATSLDTTVLGLVCAMLAGSLAWLSERHENEFADGVAAWLKERFELDKLTVTASSVGQAVGQLPAPAPAMEVLATELRVLTNQIACDARGAFEQMLQLTSGEFHRNHQKLMTEIVERQQAREEALIRRLTGQIEERLSTSLTKIGTLIQEQNSRSSRHLGRQLNRVAAALEKRTPDEVVVRYARNGHKELEVEDVGA